MVKDVRENNVAATIDPMMFFLTSSWTNWNSMCNTSNNSNEFMDKLKFNVQH